MKILIILPFKELYNKDNAGAVSILVHSHLKYSQFKKSTLICGSTVSDPMDKKIFHPIKKTRLFTNKFYIKSVESIIDNNINNVRTIFEFLRNKFDFVISISHIQAIRQYCDTQINLSKNKDGFSVIDLPK